MRLLCSDRGCRGCRGSERTQSVTLTVQRGHGARVDAGLERRRVQCRIAEA